MATSTDLPTGRRFDEVIFTRLASAAKASDSTEQAGLYLEAAHVVGQAHFKPHLQAHARMLRLPWRTGILPSLHYIPGKGGPTGPNGVP